MSKSFEPNLHFDLEGLKRFIFNDDEDGRQSDVEITETQDFDENGKLLGKTKVTREVKSVNESKQTIRYDLFKMFLSMLNDVEYPVDYDDYDEETGLPFISLSPAQELVFNTLAEYGLIKKSSSEDEKEEE